MAAQAPAYADDAEAQAAQAAEEDITFDDVSPNEGSLDASESEFAPVDESDQPASSGDALTADEGDTPLADETAPTTGEGDTFPSDNSVDDSSVIIGDAAVRPDAGLASSDPIEQVQALGIATDPSQVEGYDPAADEAPAEHEELAASDDEDISPLSDSSIRVGDWSYSESKNDAGETVCILDGYYGSATSVTLPATLGGKQMYGVKFGSSGLPKTVTSVTIPASIKEIENGAFKDTKVKKVAFAANSQLTRIGGGAFANTPLTEFTMPVHVTELGYEVFDGSSLTKLTLSTDLEPMVRSYDYISGGTTSKHTEHYNPCTGCSNVTFVVPSGCKNYRVENGALLSKDGTVLYAQFSNLGGGTYTVPSSVQYLAAKSMYGNTTFSKIVLPQGLTTMEQYCLAKTGITTLDMPDSVKHVQGSICNLCKSLTSVRIGNGLEVLGENNEMYCFAGCSNLTSVTLGSKLRVIGQMCFSATKLTSVYLPASVEQIKYGAFANISTLKSVTGGTGLAYIYSSAFENAGLTSFPFSKSLRFVSNTAFKNCKFTPSYPSYMDKQSDGYYVYDGTLAIRADKSYSLAWQVLTLVNQERAKEGLSALTMDADLLNAAMLRAAETAIYFSHTRLTGQSYLTACAKMTRENIASGSSTAQAVMNQWMNSSGHRASILSSDSKSIGIGCIKVNGRYYWVQCFGSAAATTTSKPADTSNTLIQVNYTTIGLNSLGATFNIRPVESDGTSLLFTSDPLLVGGSQRYALFAYPWGVAATPIDNSCVTWSLSSTVAKLNTSTATVTATGVGSFTITASVGGGTVKQSLTRTTALPVYTVDFNTNNGSKVASQSVTDGEKATRPADPTRTGYTFTGWYSDSALTKAYNFGTAVKSNLTLYAGWKQITYTVTFNSNGGSAVASQTVIWGSRAIRPAKPTRDGYTFITWYSDEALTTQYDFDYTFVMSDLTLYAGWNQITYNVYFVTNGGSATSTQRVAWGSKATRPADPTRTGYTFTGWYSDSALTKPYDFDTPVKTYRSIYAGWEQNTYTVDFNTNGGSSVPSQTMTWGYRPTKPADPTKAGYTFTGWYSDAALTKPYYFNSLVESDLTLYAGWKQITCRVVFNTGSGSSAVESQTVVWGSTATKPADPTWEGYTFTGWFSDTARSEAYDFNTPVKSYLMLYSGWERATYTVSFNANGGSAVTNQTVTWGYRATKPADPTKAGYTFTGWYSNAALTQAYNFYSAVKSNLTLYAGWEQITCTVTFNAYGSSTATRQTVAWGAKATKPADPTKSEFAFTGWYSDKALTKAYDFKTPVKSDMTLYAGWKQVIFTVSFNSQGGSAVANQKVALGSAATKPADPTKAGCTFTGWYTDTSFKTLYDFGKAVQYNTLLQAGWRQNSCTVTFNTNGGSAVASQTVAWGGKASKPGNPTRSGYAFGGWYSDKALSRAYDFGSAVKGNLTLYAKWAAQAAPSSFKDVASGEWYAGWVSQAAQTGLMTGMKDASGSYTGYFEPERGITRAEVATVLWRIAGSPSAKSCPLPDVSGHWAQKAVSWCYAKGVVTGYTYGPYTGRFLPDAQVSRQELAVMVWRFAKWAGVDTANPSTLAFNYCADAWLVPDWSREAMTWCAAAGIITGVQGGGRPTLSPEAGATRAMAAKIFVQTRWRCMSATGSHSDEGAAEEATQDGPNQATFEDVRAPQVTYGRAEEGLAYALVPEGAADEQGAAYVLGQAYDELGGRYVGAGVYVTGYTGKSAKLVLPAQIEGTDVVSADLSWEGDAEAGAPDPDGRTRLEGLTLERGCRLASLDASGNLLEGLALAGDEALGGLDCLRYLDLSGAQVASLDVTALPALEELGLRGCPLASEALAELASWRGATGLAADLEGAGEKVGQAGGATGGTQADAADGSTGGTQASAADSTNDLPGAATDADANVSFDTVEPGTADTDAPTEPSDATAEPSDSESAATDATNVADVAETPASPEGAAKPLEAATFDAPGAITA